MASIKNDEIERMITEVRKLNKTLPVIVLNMPEIDKNDPTDFEKRIMNNHYTSEEMIEDMKKTYKIPTEFEGMDYSVEQLIDILTPPEQMLVDNKLELTERYSENVNIRNGMRITKNQPLEYAHTIYFTGGCRIYGIGSKDDETIESYLQDLINKKSPYKYIVQNCGQLYGGGGKKYLLFPRIKEVVENYIKEGDILIIAGNFKPRHQKCYFVDFMKYCTKPYKYGEIFFEELPHLNRNGNKLLADCLFDFMIKNKILTATQATQVNEFDQEKIVEAHPVLKDSQFMSQLQKYKEYLSQYKKEGVCGGICMNANPFTNGHRYLVETAASQVDHLFILVAEENRTMFPFKDRFAMIKAGVAHLPNVTVLRGGIFVGSIITFPEYYDREVKKDMKILPSLDLLIFAEHICPVLNITKRFVGTEPLCPVTSQYNIQLKELLPEKGIELIELPRKEIGEKVVSASYVRAILKQWGEHNYSECDVERLKQLVPKTTFDHIAIEFASIFPK